VELRYWQVIATQSGWHFWAVQLPFLGLAVARNQSLSQKHLPRLADTPAAVRGQLDATGKPPGKVIDETISVGVIASSNMEDGTRFDTESIVINGQVSPMLLFPFKCAGMLACLHRVKLQTSSTCKDLAG